MDEIMESLTRLQKLCQDLNAETSRLMEACKFGEIQSNEELKRIQYFTEKMNEVRSYLVFQANKVDTERNKLNYEKQFYLWERNNRYMNNQ